MNNGLPKALSVFDQALVSVIISNYNYARYLPICVEAVLAQSYENVECIIVDDASTDESAAVIDGISRANPDLLIHKRPVNGGQSAAILDGLAKASGQFVVLLDADDVLLPNFISSHVYVHNSSRLAIGFTCSDMLQIDGDTFVSSANPTVNQFILDHPKHRFKPRPTLNNIVGRPNDVDIEILGNTYFVDNSFRSWVWSATSAMMFRKDALTLWSGTPGLSELRYSTDAFFCYGINGICGSALIDIPLAAYRFHGRNGFAARLPLNDVRGHEVGSQGERSMEALELLLHQTERDSLFYKRLFWRGSRYRALRTYLKVCLWNLRLNDLRDQSSLGRLKLLLKQGLSF